MQNLLIIAVIFVIAFLIFNTIRQRSTGVITNIASINPQHYQQQFQKPKAAHLLLDVRTPEEFAQERIAGAVNIPLQVLPERLRDVPQDQPVVLVCRSGNRTKMAAQILTKAGYTKLYDLGGLMQWKAAGLPVQ